MNPVKVAYAPANQDACALWRMFMPHLHTPDSKYIFRTAGLPVKEYEGYNVTIVQRLHTQENLRAIQILKKMGLKVIYDLDDNLWEVPKENPGRKALQLFREGFQTCASLCDLITVSTAPLKLAVHKHLDLPKGLRVEVVNNAIDFDLYAPVMYCEKDHVRVGWAGTNTHGGDLRQVYHLLPDVLRRNEHIRMEFVGMPAPELIQRHERVRQRNFVPIGEYPSRLPSWRWDIMLAPLEDNVFNKSKSNIKILEAAAIGVPILVSDVAPYKSFCALHKDLDYLVCRGPRDWSKKIEDLSRAPEERDRLAKIMKDVAQEHYAIHSGVHRWNALFRSLLVAV